MVLNLTKMFRAPELARLEIICGQLIVADEPEDLVSFVRPSQSVRVQLDSNLSFQPRDASLLEGLGFRVPCSAGLQGLAVCEWFGNNSGGLPSIQPDPRYALMKTIGTSSNGPHLQQAYLDYIHTAK